MPVLNAPYGRAYAGGFVSAEPPMTVSPYGSWKSPITSDLVVQSAIGLDQVALDGDTIYWTEIHPQKQGRYLLHRAAPDGAHAPVTPDDGRFNVRTRVHEYGGGAFAVADGTVLFSNFSDQRLYRQRDGEPIPIHAAGAEAGSTAPCPTACFASGRFICVREDHTERGAKRSTPSWRSTSQANRPRRCSSPATTSMRRQRLSPDGRRLAWLAWNHPRHALGGGGGVDRRHRHGRLGCEPTSPRRRPRRGVRPAAMVPRRRSLARLGPRRRLVESLSRPRPRSRCRADLRLAGADAAHWRPSSRGPQWQFGASCYAFCSAATVVCCFVRDGLWGFGRLDTRSKDFTAIETSFTDISQLRAGADRAVFIGGSATEAPALVDMDVRTGRVPDRAAFRRHRRRITAVFLHARAGCVYDHGRRHRPCVLLSAGLAGLYARRPARRCRCWSRATAGRPAATSSTLSLGAAVLDQPRHRPHRRQLSRLDRLSGGPTGSGLRADGASSTSRTASPARASWSPHRQCGPRSA